MKIITTIFISLIFFGCNPSKVITHPFVNDPVDTIIHPPSLPVVELPSIPHFDSTSLSKRINEKASQADLKDSLIAVRNDFPKPVDLQYLKRDVDLKATITALRDSLLNVRSLINNSSNVVSNVTVNNDLASLSTVDYLQNYKGQSASLIIADDVRGGLFNIYTGADEADNGMIFLDGLNRKWKRFTTGDKIFVKWYGVIPYTNYDKDVSNEIQKAMNYIRNHKDNFGTIQFDPCLPNTWYRLEKTLSIGGLKFYGAGGQGRQPSTRFNIARGVKVGFDIRNEYTDVKDIAVANEISYTLDSNFHTFKIRTVVHFENVSIMQNYNGNGFDISGCGPALQTAADGIFGNPDHSIFINCQAQFCLNGAYIQGCDANAMLFQNCNFAQNFSWGVYDNGFLGNTYLNTHWASNSQNKFSGARVNDTTFYPYPDSVYNIVGKYPPDNPTYWYKTNFTGSNEQWNSTRKYFGGGALWANNPNSNHAVISCYTEDFQANSIISPRSVWYEGTAGSPVKGGMWQHTFGGTTFFSGVGIAAENINALKTFVFPSTIGGALAETEITKNPATTSSTQLLLPIESGTLANANIKVIDRKPTIADVTYNTSRLWLNTSDNSLRLYVNKQGELVSILIQ